MNDFPPPDPETVLGYDPPVQEADRLLLGTPTRQAPLAVVFIAWRFVRNLGLANLGIGLVFLISGRLPLALLGFAAIASVVGLVLMTLAWWRFVFLVEADELLVRKGVVSQERLTIPLDRVQSVSIDQKLLHRFVGLVSVSVDTAGSSEAELQIDAVDRGKAEALQRLAAGHRPGTSTTGRSSSGDGGAGADGEPVGVGGALGQEGDGSVVVRRTPGDLVKIGLTAWPWTGLVVLASLFTVADDLGGLLPFDLQEEQLLDDSVVVDDVTPLLIGYVLLIALGLLLLVTVLGALLQIVREILTNWDMQLLRTSTGFRRTSGLLSRTSKASTLTRIQAVQTDETPAQRFIGITKLTLPTIGDGDLTVPGATDEEVRGIRKILFGAVPEPVLDRGISRFYIFLAVRNAFITTAIGVVIGFVVIGDWRVALAFVIVPLRWLEARRRWRLRRWSVGNLHLAESYEFLNKHTAEIDLVKTQTASVSRSFFERRRGLATVKIETAEGHLAVPLIPLAEANEVRDLALYAAESDSRAWM
ncbi:MAG: PH domain-containing protein [Actinomycetota bacterium]